MKKHPGKVVRVRVVDYRAVSRGLEKQIGFVELWDRFDDEKAQEEHLKAKEKDLRETIARLSALEAKARERPVFYRGLWQIPAKLVDCYNLDAGPKFSYFLFHDYLYQVSGPYTEDEFRLLVVDEFDRERRMFEGLQSRYVDGTDSIVSAERERIPERTRIFVWRRGGGKCARCGSRDRMEFDHIVPVSKGGSNTARNIELLCESCNRIKRDKIT
jgi:HNH endonuclease